MKNKKITVVGGSGDYVDNNQYQVKNMNQDEYRQELERRGEKWDKHLNDKKYKNVSKQGQIGMNYY